MLDSIEPPSLPSRAALASSAPAPVAVPESGEEKELVAWLIEMRDHGVMEAASSLLLREEVHR